MLPDPLVLGPLLAYFGGDPSIDAHRRAHYAGMKAKSDVSAAETTWDVYNDAYVAAVVVDRRDALKALRRVAAAHHEHDVVAGAAVHRTPVGELELVVLTDGDDPGEQQVARRELGEAQVAGHDLAAVRTVCINLSGQSLGDREFHRDAVAALERAGEAVCRRLCLEITETAAITDVADAAAFTERVRALGVRVALDDFGAGASSFGYLRELSSDVLKIDGRYIRNMLDDALDDAAVRCFVDVARLTGMKTVAEHVDRPELLERVRAIGIDYVQGYLLHEPEPLEQLFRPPESAVA